MLHVLLVTVRLYHAAEWRFGHGRIHRGLLNVDYYSGCGLQVLASDLFEVDFVMGPDVLDR